MATVEEDLKNFSQFVSQQVRDNADLQLPELFDLWLLQDPSGGNYVEDVAAVNASFNDYLNGERGTPAGEHSRSLRKEFDVE